MGPDEITVINYLNKEIASVMYFLLSLIANMIQWRMINYFDTFIFNTLNKRMNGKLKWTLHNRSLVSQGRNIIFICKGFYVYFMKEQFLFQLLFFLHIVLRVVFRWRTFCFTKHLKHCITCLSPLVTQEGVPNFQFAWRSCDEQIVWVTVTNSRGHELSIILHEID